MAYFRSFDNSRCSRVTCDDVGLVYHIDWLLVGAAYGDPSMIWEV